MRRFAVLARMFLLMNLRERETLFWFFVFPVLLLLLLGSAFASSAEDAAEVAAWLMAGVLVQNIMSAGLNGDATWLAGMRDRGVLTQLRATPLPATVLVGAYVAVRLALVLLQSALIVGVAMGVFGVRPSWGDIVPAAIVALVGALIFLALGQALAAVAANANAANVISNMLFFPLLFLSNLVIDVDAFPGWLAALSRWTPASMLVDLLRPALTTEPAAQAAWFNLVGLLLYGLLALGVVARWFRWEPRR
jgi:ABC-2 type transport system permease protein